MRGMCVTCRFVEGHTMQWRCLGPLCPLDYIMFLFCIIYSDRKHVFLAVSTERGPNTNLDTAMVIELLVSVLLL